MQIKSFQFNPFMENTFVVYDNTKEAVIIDCGALYPLEEDGLRKFIRDNNLLVKHLINTHLHLDHQFGNYFAAREFGIKPKAHPEDEPLIAQLISQTMLFGVSDKVEPQELGGYINDGDEIKFGNYGLKALHMPGHTAGSLCFYSIQAGVLFSGDVLFYGSIGRTDLPGGNYQQLIDGIKEKLLSLPDETEIYSGHGTNTTIGHERQNNPFLKCV
jgi:glyoxylase-like metal-dependent hydrolase (beta-lactamase superfamily II)